FRFAEFEIDLGQQELRRSGEVVSIEPQVFDLLVYLVRNRDRIVTKDELIEAVWQGRIVSEAALSSRVSAARRAIGDNGDDQGLIRTFPKRGFRFVGTVDASSHSPAAAEGAMRPVVEEATPDAGSARAPALPLPDKPSIAVLPFENISGDPEQDYFADGLTEDIITGLSRQRWFFVIARNSSFAYKGEAVHGRQVASGLGGGQVPEGHGGKAPGKRRVPGPADGRHKGHPPRGGRIRRRVGGGVRAGERHPHRGQRLGWPADPGCGGGTHSPKTATEHPRLGPGHAGAAAHVARERRRA